MRRILVTLTLCAAMANLSGCVLAVGNGGDDDGSTWSSADSRDSNLAHTVRANLNADQATEYADLSVSTDHDRVRLSGTVHSVDVLEKAVQLTLDTPGVRSVSCHIVVTH
ncbi:MAG TPA: BON domain-containing protein [Gammaproteobacteria bacterium]